MVTSRTGSATWPSRIIRPSAPTEKSPLTALTPEWKPLIESTSSPSSTPATSSSSVPDPASTASAWQPTPGVER